MADISRYGLPISIVDPTNTTLFATVNSQGALLVDNSSATPVVQGTVTAIPSGTYTIAPDSGSLFTVVQSTTSSQSVYGTITSVPTGTYTVDGSVSVGNFPATQTVDGTVTAVPTGTYTVSFGGTQTVDGTVTAVPTGTYTISYASSQPVYGTVTTIPNGTYTVTGSGTMRSPARGVISVSDVSAGDELISYHEQAFSIGASSTATVATYSIATPDIFNMRSVIASASSGPCKVSVKTNNGATIATGFFSSANPTLQLNFPSGFTISGQEIRVLMTNNAVASQDLYATITGRASACDPTITDPCTPAPTTTTSTTTTSTTTTSTTPEPTTTTTPAPTTTTTPAPTTTPAAGGTTLPPGFEP